MKKVEIQKLVEEKEALMAKVEAIEFEKTLVEKRKRELNIKLEELREIREGHCKRVKAINKLLTPEPDVTIIKGEELQEKIDSFKVNDYYKPEGEWTGEAPRIIATFQKLTKAQVGQLVTKFLSRKRQKDKMEQDMEFIVKLKPELEYEFTLIEYTRLAFYDGSGHGHKDDGLYIGGVANGNYNSHTIHWRKIKGKIPYCIKFSISVSKS